MLWQMIQNIIKYMKKIIHNIINIIKLIIVKKRSIFILYENR
jgi:hypothetical protein